MISRHRRIASMATLLLVVTSGCSFFSQDIRDSQACAGIQEISAQNSDRGQGMQPLALAADLRNLALPPASARLGRDIADLARTLERSALATDVSDLSRDYLEIENLVQKISNRCAELSYASAIAVLPLGGDSNDSLEVPEPEPVDEAEQMGDGRESEDSDGLPSVSSAVTELRVEPEVEGGYSRGLFDHWIDGDGNGCDTRREVLIEESLQPVTVGPGCFLEGGEWYSAFDGVTTTNPSNFDIDHFVPLKEAWDSGAHAWSDERRRDFANDLSSPSSLIAVSASSNRSKGARDPAEWLPPDDSYHCSYVEQWIEVKLYWDLSVDPNEAAVLNDVLSGC